jgi:hypothetical protein
MGMLSELLEPTEQQKADQKAKADRKYKAWVARGDSSLRLWLYAFAIAFLVFWSAVLHARAYSQDLWPIDDSRLISHETYWLIPVIVVLVAVYYKPKLPDWLRVFVKAATLLLLPAYFGYMVYDTAQGRSAIPVVEPYWGIVEINTTCGKGKYGALRDCSNFHQEVTVFNATDRVTHAYRYSGRSEGYQGVNCYLFQRLMAPNGSQWLRVMERDFVEYQYDKWGVETKGWDQVRKDCVNRSVTPK